MKKFLLATFAIAAAFSVRATLIPMPVNISIRASVQNENVTDAKGFTTTGKPLQMAINTKSLLAIINADENRASHYSGTFPTGAKLVYVNNDTNLSESYFIVTDQSGFELVNVSDVISFQPTGTELVFSGSRSDSNGLWKSENEVYIGTLSFDDTGDGGNLSFSISGNVNSTLKQSLKTTITYDESIIGNMKNASGEGLTAGTPMMLTGGMSAKGTVKSIFFPVS